MLKDHNYSKLTFRLPKSGPKSLKWTNLFIWLLLQHFSQGCLVSLFLFFFYILYEIEEPYVLKTDGASFFGKILACPKMSQKCPKWPNLFICPLLQHFLRIDSLVVFFIFCMKLRDRKCWRLTESDFLGKFLLARKRANRLKISTVYLFARFYNIFLRSDSSFFFVFVFFCFLIFGMNFRDHKYSKLTELRFFEKIFSRPKSGQKWHDLDLAQNDAICVFLHYDSPFFKIGSLVFFHILRKVEGP